MAMKNTVEVVIAGKVFLQIEVGVLDVQVTQGTPASASCSAPVSLFSTVH